MSTVTALKRCSLCSDRLLSPVVDGTQLKLQQQMEKHYREAFRATSHAPSLCAAAAAYIWQSIKSRGSHISSAQTHPGQPGKGGS